MDPQLRSQLRQTITVRPYSGTVNEYGEQEYGATYTAKCRIAGTNKKLTRPDGEEVVASFQIITEASITVNDAIWLPGETSSDKPHDLMSVQTAVGERGEYDFTEVYL